MLAFGAIGWPWLLRSLGDGGREARATLIERIGLGDADLPPLGSWRGDAVLLGLIADHILERRPRVVVEFGSGVSTIVAARCLQIIGGGHLLSIDQSAEFAGDARARLAALGLKADIEVAPLGPSPTGGPGLWYDHRPLPDAIDLMLVDGPPWSVHPFVRGAASAFFGRITPGGTVMLDDAARPGERLVARRWRREHPDFDFRYMPGPAGTLIGTRRA